MTASSGTFRIEGIATALSSISHGGEHAGTVAYLRREKIVQPDGTVADVPIIAGNSLRGILRDHAADVFWRSLGSPPLPLPVFHLLWSGGALAKTGSAHVLGARQLAQVRDLVPVVSLFGGSGAGKIIEGRLQVGKLVPVCAETAHLMPDAVVGEQPRSIWELLQVEEFTRRDDAKRDQLHTAINGLDPAALPSGQSVLLEIAEHQPAVEDAGDTPAQQMRYGVETLAAGTRLHWWVRLADVTDVECALFAAALGSWVAAGAHIGGRSATGHGRLKLDSAQWSHQTPQLTVGDSLALDQDPLEILAAHAAAHKTEIIEALGWFA
jgi:CRISPR type IV-associated protein Csf2